MKYALSSNFLCLSWPKFMKLGQGRFPIWSRPALLIDLFFWRGLNIVTTILLFKPDLLLIQLRPAREKRGFSISLEDEFTKRRKTWSWTGAWKVKKMTCSSVFCFCAFVSVFVAKKEQVWLIGKIKWEVLRCYCYPVTRPHCPHHPYHPFFSAFYFWRAILEQFVLVVISYSWEYTSILVGVKTPHFASILQNQAHSSL